MRRILSPLLQSTKLNNTYKAMNRVPFRWNEKTPHAFDIMPRRMLSNNLVSINATPINSHRLHVENPEIKALPHINFWWNFLNHKPSKFGFAAIIGTLIIGGVYYKYLRNEEEKTPEERLKNALIQQYSQYGQVTSLIHKHKLPIADINFTEILTKHSDISEQKNRLQSDEAKEQKLVGVAEIFNSESSTNDVEQVYITGEAGTGKTVLSGDIVYRWSHKGLWSDKSGSIFFDFIFLLPLRQLNQEHYINISHKIPSISEIVYAECLEDEIKNKFKIEVNDIERILQSKRVLFILDGYDEIVHLTLEETHSVKKTPSIKKILDNFFKSSQYRAHIILTSRPHYSPPEHYSYQRHLKVADLASDQIDAYINSYFSNIKVNLDQQDLSEQLKDHLKAHLHIRNIAQVPLNLALICDVWYNQALDKSESDSENIFLTVTNLYNELLHQLLKRHLKERKNQCTHNVGDEIKEICKVELTYLERLAFYVLRDQKQESTGPLQRQISAEVKGQYPNLQDDPYTLAFAIGILTNIPDGRQEEIDQKHYFLHLTFQEYFAAMHVVRQLQDAKSAEYPAILTFLAQNKYNPSYQVMFKFIAGLLAKKDGLQEPMKVFWRTLWEAPRDLVGVGSLKLLIQSLDEIQGDVSVPCYREMLEAIKLSYRQAWMLDKGEAITDLLLKHGLHIDGEEIVFKVWESALESLDLEQRKKAKQLFCLNLRKANFKKISHKNKIIKILRDLIINDQDIEIRDQALETLCRLKNFQTYDFSILSINDVKEIILASSNKNDAIRFLRDYCYNTDEKIIVNDNELKQIIIDLLSNKNIDIYRRSNCLELLSFFSKKNLKYKIEFYQIVTNLFSNDFREFFYLPYKLFEELFLGYPAFKTKIISAIFDEDEKYSHIHVLVGNHSDVFKDDFEAMQKIIGAASDKSHPKIRAKALKVLATLGKDIVSQDDLKACVKEVIKLSVLELHEIFETDDETSDALKILGPIIGKFPDLCEQIVDDAANNQNLQVKKNALTTLGYLDANILYSNQVDDAIISACFDKNISIKDIDSLTKIGKIFYFNDKIYRKLINGVLNEDDSQTRIKILKILSKSDFSFFNLANKYFRLALSTIGKSRIFNQNINFFDYFIMKWALVTQAQDETKLPFERRLLYLIKSLFSFDHKYDPSFHVNIIEESELEEALLMPALDTVNFDIRFAAYEAIKKITPRLMVHPKVVESLINTLSLSDENEKSKRTLLLDFIANQNMAILLQSEVRIRNVLAAIANENVEENNDVKNAIKILCQMSPNVLDQDHNVQATLASHAMKNLKKGLGTDDNIFKAICNLDFNSCHLDMQKTVIHMFFRGVPFSDRDPLNSILRKADKAIIPVLKTEVFNLWDVASSYSCFRIHATEVLDYLTFSPDLLRSINRNEILSFFEKNKVFFRQVDAEHLYNAYFDNRKNKAQRSYLHFFDPPTTYNRWLSFIVERAFAEGYAITLTERELFIHDGKLRKPIPIPDDEIKQEIEYAFNQHTQRYHVNLPYTSWLQKTASPVPKNEEKVYNIWAWFSGFSFR